MQERHGQFSRDAMNDFLDFAGEKGLLKKTTAKARKDASKIVLRILDDNEAADLSKVDLESVIQRHRNLATGKIMPRTLAAYESRTRIAVRDFLEYVKSPSTWGAGQQRIRKPPKATPSKRPKTGTSGGKPEDFEKHEEMTRRPSVHIDLQIHISPEADAKQIEQIFASMSRYLYGNRTDK